MFVQFCNSAFRFSVPNDWARDDVSDSKYNFDNFRFIMRVKRDLESIAGCCQCVTFVCVWSLDGLIPYCFFTSFMTLPHVSAELSLPDLTQIRPSFVVLLQHINARIVRILLFLSSLLFVCFGISCTHFSLALCLKVILIRTRLYNSETVDVRRFVVWICFFALWPNIQSSFCCFCPEVRQTNWSVENYETRSVTLLESGVKDCVEWTVRKNLKVLTARVTRRRSADVGTMTTQTTLMTDVAHDANEEDNDPIVEEHVDKKVKIRHFEDEDGL